MFDLIRPPLPMEVSNSIAANGHFEMTTELPSNPHVRNAASDNVEEGQDYDDVFEFGGME